MPTPEPRFYLEPGPHGTWHVADRQAAFTDETGRVTRRISSGLSRPAADIEEACRNVLHNERAARAALAAAERPTLVIEVEGGVVQSVYATGDAAHWPTVVVADFDNQALSDDRLRLHAEILTPFVHAQPTLRLAVEECLTDSANPTTHP